MIEPLDITKKINELRIENIKKAFLNPEQYHHKIERIAERLGISKTILLKEYIEHPNPLLVYTSPLQQNLTEIFVEEYLKTYLPEAEVVILNKSGPNAKFYIQGEVVLGGDIGNFTKNTESIDMEVIYEGITYYISHKYIHESGGSQNNQFKRLVHYYKACLDNRLNHTVFVAMYDGEYFESNRIQKEITNLPTKDNVWFLTTTQFVKRLLKQEEQ